MKTFNEILESLLGKLDNGKTAEKIIEETQLSDENKKLLEKVNKLLDAFEEKAASLQAAKENGDSNRKWMYKQLERITEGRSEEEKTILINAMSKVESDNLEKALTQEK